MIRNVVVSNTYMWTVMLMCAFRVYEVLILNTFDDADEGAQKQLPVVTHVDADSFFTQLS